MSRKSKQPVQEDAPLGTPAWMLTFCDCMTLLLTFFVLLLSFSSFDESKEKQLYGSLKFKYAPSILENEEKIDASVSIEVPPVQDITDKGAEKKRSDDKDVVKNPKKVEIPSTTEAYHKETVLSIPLEGLFFGQSIKLTPAGRDVLGRIAAYLKLKPCYAIIGESSPQNVSSGSLSGAGAGLQRSWAVMKFLNQCQALSPERSWISGECPRPRHSKQNKPAMQIVLLARDITRLPARR